MIKLPKVLPEPTRVSHVPATAQWLAGEGAGSWFVVEPTGADLIFTVARYAPEGTCECKSVFCADAALDTEQAYQITYPAHCLKVTVLQGSKKITLLAEA